jgi:hypothetical protein
LLHLMLQLTQHTTKCERGLAPDGGVSVTVNID